MNAQVDPLQVLDVHLDRRAVRVSQLASSRLSDCFSDRRAIELAIESYGAKITRIDGEEWVIKNNSQRERVVLDKAAMAWFLQNVAPGGRSWTRSRLVSAVNSAGVSWTAFKRICIEMGYYLVGQELRFVGYEMDHDTRLRVCRALREASEDGLDLDSDLAYTVASAREVEVLSERDFEICVALVKNGFAATGVELN